MGVIYTETDKKTDVDRLTYKGKLKETNVTMKTKRAHCWGRWMAEQKNTTY